MAQIDPNEVEAVEVSKEGYAIGLDLVRLEATRFGLELVGIGYGLTSILGTLGLLASGELSRVFGLLAALASLVLIVGLQQTAPTPNGFLPAWVRRAFVLILVLGTAHSVLGLFADRSWARPVFGWLWSARIDVLATLVLVGLPWILWRFSQHRGLIGRAITWLWIALVSTGLYVAGWVIGAIPTWMIALEPAIGVLFAVTAHYTARDVWLDAVNRKTKKIASRRPAAPDETPA